LKKAKTTLNGADFTKANALYNAALVRSRRVHHEIEEDQILRRIVKTYREFLYAFAKDDFGISVDEIQNEIDSRKRFLANERRVFKERVDEIKSCFNTNDKTEDQYKVFLNCRSTCMQQPLALLTKELYFPNMKYLKIVVIFPYFSVY
jgi:hypothetical protein